MLDESALAAAMRSAQDGNPEAYRRLLRDCIPIISIMVRAQGIRGAAVDDVVQDTLLTVHRARATYDPGRPFLPWLRAIARRRAIDVIRQNSRRPLEVTDDLAYEGHADDAAGPEHGIEASQNAAGLAAAVASLPEGQRQAVEQLALRELSLQEVSALTGRSVGALKVNLHRALKALRITLASEKGKGDD